VTGAQVRQTSRTQLTATFLPAAIGIGYGELRWQVLSAPPPSACVPRASSQIGCLALFPARPALSRLHIPRLVGCVPTGPAFVARGPADRHAVALSFDDGPWTDTHQFLQVLERERVPATFFEIGEQIAIYGEGGAVERRMLADGDMIGDHTWSHANVAAGGSFAAAQILRTAAAIRRATGGFTPCLFRAPYGAVSPALIGQARALGFTTIQWDVDPRDWSRPGSEAIYEAVTSNVRNGAIVIQHDGGGDRAETLRALPREIDRLRREGYTFVTVTQLLGQPLIYR
jgi:peptidoglycan/xylan/chitin deacetylase (PgdA/CDA1 family)